MEFIFSGYTPPGFTKATKFHWLPFLRPGKPSAKTGVVDCAIIQLHILLLFLPEKKTIRVCGGIPGFATKRCNCLCLIDIIYGVPICADSIPCYLMCHFSFLCYSTSGRIFDHVPLLLYIKKTCKKRYTLFKLFFQKIAFLPVPIIIKIFRL